MRQLIYATIISFAIVIIVVPLFIPFLRKLKFGQNIREEGPQSHHIKSGTPTMGGVVMLIGILITSIFFVRNNSNLVIALLITMGFGLVGFLDDYIKVILKRNLGLRAYQKIILQVILASFLAIYAANHTYIGTSLLIPFTSRYLDLGLFYIPFTVFVIVGVVNAVNLTDGLDGLASGVSLIVSAFFALTSLANGYHGLGIFAGTVVGACLGFLRYNAFPAQVFMGDTGSLSLGGAIVVLAVLTKMQLFLPIIGGIFMIEAISVMLQVSYFKITKGKRIFKMAPIHHHYELLGWHETKIVITFWIVTIILTLISILALSIF